MSPLFDPSLPMDAARTVALYQRYYEQHGPSLPSGKRQEMRFVSHLHDCLDELEGLILDSYGVIGLGSAPIDGIASFFEAATRRDIPLIILTNGASKEAKMRVPVYQSWGLNITAEDIISSRDACYQELKMREAGGSKQKICYLGDDVMPFKDIEGTLYGQAGWQDADLFAFMGAVSWQEADQLALEDVLRARPASNRAEIIVANPDISAPQVSGFSFEPGFWAMRAMENTGCQITMTGKPFASAYEIAFDALQKKAGRSLQKNHVGMVGDSLHTDILGANHFGLTSILLRGYGLMSAFDIHHITDEAQIYPHIIAEHI